jgi:hypothetical protein
VIGNCFARQIIGGKTVNGYCMSGFFGQWAKDVVYQIFL